MKKLIIAFAILLLLVMVQIGGAEDGAWVYDPQDSGRLVFRDDGKCYQYAKSGVTNEFVEVPCIKPEPKCHWEFKSVKSGAMVSTDWEPFDSYQVEEDLMVHNGNGISYSAGKIKRTYIVLRRQVCSP